MSRRCAVAASALALLALGLPPAAASEPAADPEAIVGRAVAEAGAPAKQAEALARLAWPEAPRDEALARAAMERLRGYGRHALPVLSRMMWSVPAERQHEVCEVVIDAVARQEMIDLGPYYGVIDDVLWQGTRRSRELVIPEAGRLRHPNHLLPLIDVAIEDPELLPAALDALERYRDPRARFFLAGLLHHEDAGIRQRAADILGRTGGAATTPLREALRSEAADVRAAALNGLLPYATVEDLSALYEYYGAFPDDDAALLERVRRTAFELERRLEATRAAESASPDR